MKVKNLCWGSVHFCLTRVAEQQTEECYESWGEKGRGAWRTKHGGVNESRGPSDLHLSTRGENNWREKYQAKNMCKTQTKTCIHHNPTWTRSVWINQLISMGGKGFKEKVAQLKRNTVGGRMEECLCWAAEVSSWGGGVVRVSQRYRHIQEYFSTYRAVNCTNHVKFEYSVGKWQPAQRLLSMHHL